MMMMMMMMLTITWAILTEFSARLAVYNPRMSHTSTPADLCCVNRPAGVQLYINDNNSLTYLLTNKFVYLFTNTSCRQFSGTCTKWTNGTVSVYKNTARLSRLCPPRLRAIAPCGNSKFSLDSDIKIPNLDTFDIGAEGFPIETVCNPQFRLKVTK